MDWDVLMRRLLHLLDRNRPEPARVLAVEDDPLQAGFVRTVLGSAGYEVRVCDDPLRETTTPASVARRRLDVQAFLFAEGGTAVASDAVERAMDRVLGSPTTCPHGNPIPGSLYLEPVLVPLADVVDGVDG